MYKLKKTINISCGHFLPGHDRCGQQHGHNYNITVYASCDNTYKGMVIDFNEIKAS